MLCFRGLRRPHVQVVVVRVARRCSTLSGEVEQLTNATFFKRLWAGGDRAALVCFTAPSCGACRMFKRILPTLREHAESQSKESGFSLDVYEVDAGENMGLVGRCSE